MMYAHSLDAQTDAPEPSGPDRPLAAELAAA